MSHSIAPRSGCAGHHSQGLPQPGYHPGSAVTEKGLADVVAAETAISDIDGKLGRLWYVGYDIHDLARWSTFEETVFLLHRQRLPTRNELEDLTQRLVEERELDQWTRELMPTFADVASPMSMLRTSVSASSGYDPDGGDQSGEANQREARRLGAPVPTPIAAFHRLRAGEDMVPPNPKLPHAANFLFMLLGEE